MGDSRDIATLKLADSGLPLRVREIATRLLHLCESEFNDRIRLMLVQLEAQLFRQAERARSPSDQSDLLKAVQVLSGRGPHFAPAYFSALEARLAALRRVAGPVPALQAAGKRALSMSSSEWTLAESMPAVEAEAAQLRDLASPIESAANLPLYLLGQRFGVLAGAPAFSPEQICLGPRTLIELAGKAAFAVFGETVPSSILQSHFTQHVLGDYPAFVERVNAALDEAGVLPGLTYVPVRPTKATKGAKSTGDAAEDETHPEHDEDTAHSDAEASTPPATETRPAPPRATPAHTPHYGGTAAQDDVSHWLEQPDLGPRALPPAAHDSASGMPAPAAFGGPGAAAPGSAEQGGVPAHSPAAMPAPQSYDFRTLQQLLTAHRIAGKLPPRPAPPPGAELARIDIDRFLQELQSGPAVDASHARSIHGLRETLLQRARAELGPMADLGREEADKFEILSLLYAEVAREVRAGSSVHGLLERLQLPILRVALRDGEFFDEAAHPGRQLLNTIAESDASAYGNDGSDPYFEAAMHKAVERIEDDVEASPEVLVEVNEELQSQFRQQIKRSQASEKRLVEAARGRERMAIAKESAEDALNELIAEHKPARAIEVLLRRAWLDALTLVALRHGVESEIWHAHLAITRDILTTVNATHPLQSAELAKQVEEAIVRVGYHQGEAAAVARNLSRSATAPRSDDEPAITEVSARIKAHARLGEDEDTGNREGKDRRARLAPRTPHEEECYQHLRTLPFGCWMDFVQNQQGEAERRRLSWYSTITNKALFVNRRGQRVAELHMDELARLMSQGQLLVVERTQLRLIDRAFRSASDMLRNTLRRPDRPSLVPRPT